MFLLHLRRLDFIICLLVCCSLGISAELHAQLQEREPTLWRVGVFGSYGTYLHATQFDSLPGVDLDGIQFTNAIGTGWTAGVLFEKPLSHKFSLAARLAFHRYDVAFKTRTDAVFSFNAVPVYGSIEYGLNSRISAITADPLLAWHPFQNASVYLGARIGASFGSFDYAKNLIDSTGQLVFVENNQRVLPLYPDTPLPPSFIPQLSGTAGISYAIALDPDETLFLAPEVWYSYNATPLINGMGEGRRWNVHSLHGGLSLRFSPEAARRYLPPAIVRTAETDGLAINIVPLALDMAGVESPMLRLRMEEFLSQQVHPLLPYIFFDDARDTVPARYLRLTTPQQTSQFSTDALSRWGTLEIYYHLLNIVGKRLREFPTATLKIVGCVSEREAGIVSNAGTASAVSSTDAPTLAARRAESVMAYLRDVWRVQPFRLVIDSSAGKNFMPLHPNTLGIESGFAENRRVELASDDARILAPLVLSDTLLEATPAAVKFQLRANTRQPVVKWVFVIEQARKNIRTASGVGMPVSEIVWHPSREHRTVPRLEDVVRCNFDFLQQAGEGGTATISLPVEQISLAKKRRQNFGIGSETMMQMNIYRLINFDANSETPTPAHKRIINEIAQRRIETRSKVTITGYTDAAGETAGTSSSASTNTVLSERRAANVAQLLLKSITPGGSIPTPLIKGMGSTMSIYPETIPEGRFYARSVEIRIESP
jgi:outer membrane protein OmpA-like peptidoglycan-associated protein